MHIYRGHKGLCCKIDSSLQADQALQGLLCWVLAKQLASFFFVAIMGWSDVDEEFLEMSQKSADSLDGDSEAETGPVGDGTAAGSPIHVTDSSSSASENEADQMWWVKLLKERCAHLKFGGGDGPWTVVSVCSGMLAEAFDLQAGLRVHVRVSLRARAGAYRVPK